MAIMIIMPKISMLSAFIIHIEIISKVSNHEIIKSL